MLESNVIEVAPLAFMRGRTLSDAFIIMDEAQNTTTEQMKMFVTRLGHNSKAVITGDLTQTDLPTRASPACWRRCTFSMGWRGFASATLKMWTSSGITWSSASCVPTTATARPSSFRWPWKRLRRLLPATFRSRNPSQNPNNSSQSAIPSITEGEAGPLLSSYCHVKGTASAVP